MLKTELTSTCGQCPFIKGEGPRGYVGPYDNALQLHKIGMELEYPCHIRDGHTCVGAQLHRKVNCKGMQGQFRQEVIDHQKACVEANGTDKAMFGPDFLKHHDLQELAKERKNS